MAVKKRMAKVAEFEMRCECGVAVMTDMQCPECGKAMKIVSTQESGELILLHDLERSWFDVLMPGFGSNHHEVFHYILRSWILDHMGLDWMQKKRKKGAN